MKKDRVFSDAELLLIDNYSAYLNPTAILLTSEVNTLYVQLPLAAFLTNKSDKFERATRAMLIAFNLGMDRGTTMDELILRELFKDEV